MKRLYAFMLAMVLILSSFVFSACSSQDGGTDTGNGNGQGSSNNVSGADQNKVDNTDTNNESDASGSNNNGNNNNGNNNAVEELGDDAKRTVDDVLDAGQQ